MGQKILEMAQKGCLSLSHLSINGCQINDLVMEKLAPALVSITELSLADNPEISDAGWKSLSDALNGDYKLKFISLRSSKQLNILPGSNKCLKQLADVLSKMEEVDITGQLHVTNEVLQELQDIYNQSLGQGFELKRITISKYHSKSENNTEINIPSLEVSVFDSIEATEVV